MSNNSSTPRGMLSIVMILLALAFHIIATPPVVIFVPTGVLIAATPTPTPVPTPTPTPTPEEDEEQHETERYLLEPPLRYSHVQ